MLLVNFRSREPPGDDPSASLRAGFAGLRNSAP